MPLNLMNPLGAMLDGIQSFFWRAFVYVGVLALGGAFSLARPDQDPEGWLLALLIWPLAGLPKWADAPGPAVLCTVLVPVGILSCARCFVSGAESRISLWLGASLAVLWTAPDEAGHYPPVTLLGVWSTLQVLIFGIRAWLRNHLRIPS